MTEENDELSPLTFSLTEHILTFDSKNNIHIKGSFLDDADNDDCVLCVPIRLWNKMFKEFLRLKNSLHKAWEGEYCGVEFITIHDYKIMGEATIIDSIDEETDEVKYKAVPLIKVKSIDVEMEHG